MVIKNVRLKFGNIHQPNDEGKYTAAFFVENKKDEEALIKLIDEAWESGKGSYSGEASLAYSEYEAKDAGDEDDGKIIFNASQRANSPDGQYEFFVKVYDSDANLIGPKEVPAIGWGTIGDINVSTYIWTYKRKKGCKLNLEGFMIVDLVEYSGENPFEARSEGGYKAPTNPFRAENRGSVPGLDED